MHYIFQDTKTGKYKNGTMAARYIQGIHIITIIFILQRHVKGHEMLTKICLCRERVAPDHYKGNDEQCIRLTGHIEKKKPLESEELSETFLTDTFDRA